MKRPLGGSVRQSKSLRLLTINTGSSSLKAALYRMDSIERRDLMVHIERIGDRGGRLCITGSDGVKLLDEQRELPDHDAALRALFDWLRKHRGDFAFDAVGHRVVHGGLHFCEPQQVTPMLVAGLETLTALDPDHLPQAIAAIELVDRTFPNIRQVACFDTAFHRGMPAVAQRYALPREYHDAGVIRYGFHGLSYESVMQALRADDPTAAKGRLIIAHLGNGASMAAVQDGIGIDTTMGFTPTGGLVMGTRSGDLDPSVVLHLLRSHGMTPDQASRLLNKEAGMRGVSGTSGDMRDLRADEASSPGAAEAIELFCYQAKKFAGALAAVLGGLDTLIFTGGIGESSAPVRERICTGLGFLGIELDAARNAAHATIISRDGSSVTLRVMPTDEDLMIARHAYRLLARGGSHDVSI